jgi:hypothetical protein
MRYQVPQFIEVEDKIFGPLTFKQFIYLAGGAALAYICYKTFPIYIALFFMIAAVGLAVALAFYKINNRPFVKMLESAFNYFKGNKLYIWKRADKKPVGTEIEQKTDAQIYVPKLSESKLKDLTWSLDINDTLYSQEERKLQKMQHERI